MDGRGSLLYKKKEEVQYICTFARARRFVRNGQRRCPEIAVPWTNLAEILSKLAAMAAKQVGFAPISQVSCLSAPRQL
jgi:hypothetical protein